MKQLASLRSSGGFKTFTKNGNTFTCDVGDDNFFFNHCGTLIIASNRYEHDPQFKPFQPIDKTHQQSPFRIHIAKWRKTCLVSVNQS